MPDLLVPRTGYSSGDRSEPNEEGRSSTGVDEVNSTTRRFPRTMHSSDAAFPRDSDYANPYGWRQSARDAIAEEQRIRQMFADGERGPESRSSVWAHRVIAVIALGVVVAVLWGKL